METIKEYFDNVRLDVNTKFYPFHKVNDDYKNSKSKLND